MKKKHNQPKINSSQKNFFFKKIFMIMVYSQKNKKKCKSLVVIFLEI